MISVCFIYTCIALFNLCISNICCVCVGNKRYTYIDDDANRVLSVDVSDQSFWELGGWSTDDAKSKAKEGAEMKKKDAKYKHTRKVRTEEMGPVDNP